MVTSRSRRWEGPGSTAAAPTASLTPPPPRAWPCFQESLLPCRVNTHQSELMQHHRGALGKSENGDRSNELGVHLRVCSSPSLGKSLCSRLFNHGRLLGSPVSNPNADLAAWLQAGPAAALGRDTTVFSQACPGRATPPTRQGADFPVFHPLKLHVAFRSAAR